MARLRLFPAILQLLLGVFLAVCCCWRWSSHTAFLGAVVADGEEAVLEAPASRGPLDWFHHDVLIYSHRGYPITLMIGFNCFGNVLLRKECGGNRYPNWLFGYLLGFICYTYPGAIFSDLVLIGTTPRPMANDNILCCYTFWFLAIQYCEPVYRFLCHKYVFVFLTTWWLADATRASMVFLERAVAHQAILARGVFQAFVWCVAGPIMRVAEMAIRGVPVKPLDAVQPNSLNAFKYPLITMWMTMLAYMGYLMKFTDCGLFTKDGLNMVECGAKHDDVFAAFTYLGCALHLGRSFWAMHGQQKMVFGEVFCMSAKP